MIWLASPKQNVFSINMTEKPRPVLEHYVFFFLLTFEICLKGKTMRQKRCVQGVMEDVKHGRFMRLFDSKSKLFFH